jgi:predicted transcriptional regulator of viral defense system/very-short-patch-repair endonuclease
MHQERRSHHGLARLAEEQHGVVSIHQLRELGYSDGSFRHALYSGRLHPVFHGVYAVGNPGLSQHGECIAAVLSCGADAVLSHRSAAWLWALTSRFTRPIEVTAASPRDTRRLIRVHSAAALTPRDHATHEGIPVTAIPRTSLDFAATDPAYLGQALDNASRLGLLDMLAMDELVSRSKGFRGVARLRAALVIHRSATFTRSGLERRFLQLVKRAGLPQPSTNLFIEGYELDAYWPAERFAVELDTYDYHGDPRAFEADRIRHESLKLAGIEMVRITGNRMDREPESIARRLHLLLERRRRELGITASPPG